MKPPGSKRKPATAQICGAKIGIFFISQHFFAFKARKKRKNRVFLFVFVLSALKKADRLVFLHQ